MALADTWQEVRDNRDIRVAVLTGAGDRDFCCGGDLGGLIPLWTGARKPETVSYTHLDVYKRQLSTTSPPTGVAPPHNPVLPPCGTIGTPVTPTPETVSYTHLDVYKRQACARPNKLYDPPEHPLPRTSTPITAYPCASAVSTSTAFDSNSVLPAMASSVSRKGRPGPYGEYNKIVG